MHAELRLGDLPVAVDVNRVEERVGIGVDLRHELLIIVAEAWCLAQRREGAEAGPQLLLANFAIGCADGAGGGGRGRGGGDPGTRLAALRSFGEVGTVSVELAKQTLDRGGCVARAREVRVELVLGDPATAIGIYDVEDVVRIRVESVLRHGQQTADPGQRGDAGRRRRAGQEQACAGAHKRDEHQNVPKRHFPGGLSGGS